MIHEWRTYRLKPGAAGQYLGLFAERGLPLVTKHLPLMGYWLAETGPLNVIHHLWSYTDWSEREARRAALSRESEWIDGFIPDAFTLVEEQQNRLLRLSATSADFETALAGRCTVGAMIPRGAPLFANQWAGLVTGAAPDGAIATWQTLSGGAPQSIALLARSTEPLPMAVDAEASHTVLRPLLFSPL
jgi:hypothetical protein